VELSLKNIESRKFAELRQKRKTKIAEFEQLSELKFFAEFLLEL
jgi:hypothetical protein